MRTFWLSSMVAATLGLLTAVPAQAQERHGPGLAGEAQNLAEDVGRWLIENGRDADAGTWWPADALAPEEPARDLSMGTAGVVVFLAALARTSGEPAYLEAAAGGADWLSATALQEDAWAADDTRRASLYTGLAGIGAALMAMDRPGQRSGHRDAVEGIVDRLSGWAQHDGDAVSWSPQFNDLLYGDAGTVLFLAFVADRYGDEDALELAIAGGRGLIGQRQSADTGRYWHFRRDRDFNLPNFSHGTAGIVYVLATLHRLTGDDAFGEAAREGFEYLRSIALVEDGRILMPYGWPNETWEGLYAYGWGHGVAGSALAFRRLQQAGIATDAARRFERMAIRTLAESGLPDEPRAPIAEASTPLDYRFGRAGVLSVVSRLGQEDDAAGSSLSGATAAYLERAALRAPGTAHWPTDRPAFMGEGRAAFTGLFHGAAGIGLALLHLHERETGRAPAVLMPDDPRWLPGD